jgi:hypothetical protein
VGEDLNVSPADVRPPHPAQQLLRLAREHRAGDHLDAARSFHPPIMGPWLEIAV